MTLVNLKPSDEFEFKPGQGKVLLLACGALGREIVDLIERNRWTAFDLQCLPAKWHNTPDKIVPALREKIREAKPRYQSIFVLYGDCGTGGDIDKLLAEEGIEYLQLDDHMAALEGSVGAIPRRIRVLGEDLPRARLCLGNAALTRK